jgi:Effector-associated domain 11
MIFTERIEKLLASNQLRDVIDEFLRFLNEVPQSDKHARNDANQLRGQVILLSGQFTDLNTKVNSSTIDPSLANRERSTIINSFIQILNQLPSSYPDLNNYITEKNEDDEWKEAQQKNTIEEYQDYFSKYPNGRYKEETIKLITKLEDIKSKQESEMKEVAAREKARRESEKAAENTAHKTAYQEPKVQQSYRSANTPVAPPPAKSRTGLYIALGALLGILFIIIIAVSLAGDDNKLPDVEPQPVDNGGSPSAVNPWPQSEEDAFIVQCQNTAVNTVGAELAVPYCNCMLQKIKVNYSSFVEANTKMAAMTQEELAAMALDCLVK